MSKIFILLLLVVFSSCCSSPSSKDREFEYAIEIRNKDMVEAITEYQAKMSDEFRKEIEQGDSVYVGVWSKEINDSISRYILCPVAQVDYLEFVVPFDLCHINGHYVVVSHRSVSNFRQTPITLSEKVYRCYEKKLFPKQYEERENKVERGFILCSSDYCYLTFLGDSLINKSYHHGMRSDKILIKLNDKEVYL